jgi:hypothetical protein
VSGPQRLAIAKPESVRSMEGFGVIEFESSAVEVGVNCPIGKSVGKKPRILALAVVVP